MCNPITPRGSLSVTQPERMSRQQKYTLLALGAIGGLVVLFSVHKAWRYHEELTNNLSTTWSYADYAAAAATVAGSAFGAYIAVIVIEHLRTLYRGQQSSYPHTKGGANFFDPNFKPQGYYGSGQIIKEN